MFVTLTRPGAVEARTIRNTVSIDADWHLCLDSAIGPGVPQGVGYDDSRWRVVNLPHDYVIEQPYTSGLDPQRASLPTPSAWYRKTIVVPRTAAARDYWLDFDGIFRDSTVYVNGRLAGRHESGYVPAHLDVSSFVEPGKPLTIAVHVDPSRPEGWWYEGGGIYRHVRFTSADRLHIQPDGVSVVAKVIGPESKPGAASLEISISLANSSDRAKHCRLLCRVIGPDGSVVATQSQDQPGQIQPGAGTTVTTRTSLSKPALWSLEAPNLYELETAVESDGRVVDEVVTPFGVRTVRFDADKGFLLNGKVVKIKGVCNHQDFAGIGIAVPDNLQYWRVLKMKSFGANAWRMSHNPPSSELLDACDKLGMLVLDENRHLGDTYDAHSYWDGTPAADLKDLEAMVIRDRNHPSVIAWSLCNEEPLQGTAAGAAILEKMFRRVRALDPDRPITCAMNGQWGKGFSGVVDLQGCNYFNESFLQFHKRFPDKPMLFTETSSAVSDRGIYVNDPARCYVGSYTQAVQDGWPDWITRSEESWIPIADNSFLAGSFVWTGFDYRGEPSPYGWPSVGSHFGILDLCGFPKDVYYYYKAVWLDQPLIHITPHWNWNGQEGKPIRVVVFTNADEVELRLNGSLIGRQKCPRYRHASWKVDYQPGTLTARGYDSSGRLIATEDVSTTGREAGIQLRTDLSRLSANGCDESVVEAAIVDSRGRIVPTAGDSVTFRATGDSGFVVGTGNGDPSDHTPDSSCVRSAFSGRLAAIIRSTGKRGILRVIASAPGLRPATLVLRFR